MVTMTITGTMGSAGAVYSLIDNDGYDINYGSWLEPVTVRNIPLEEAEALKDILFTESEGHIKSVIEE